MFTTIAARYARWRRVRRTRRVLDTLDDRMLKDVGLRRRSSVEACQLVMLRTLGLR